MLASIVERIDSVKDFKDTFICLVLLIGGSFSASNILSFAGNFDQFMRREERGDRADEIGESDIFNKTGLWSLDNVFRFRTSE